MPDTIDLPALRAVIATLRMRARVEGHAGTLHGCLTGDCPHIQHRDCFDALREEIADLARFADLVKPDLTTLASACERLAEENERARERIAALTPPDGYVFVLCAPELANQMMNQWSDPVQLKVDSVEANWLTFVARKLTPAPAGKGEA